MAMLKEVNDDDDDYNQNCYYLQEVMMMLHVLKLVKFLAIMFRLVAGAEERYVGAGENTILECEEARHQQGLSSVEWFCRWEQISFFRFNFSLIIFFFFTGWGRRCGRAE